MVGTLRRQDMLPCRNGGPGPARVSPLGRRCLHVGKRVLRAMATKAFRMRVHRQGREVLVAVSDAELVGKKFTEGKLQLHVAEAFYGTDDADATEVLQMLRVCT